MFLSLYELLWLLFDTLQDLNEAATKGTETFSFSISLARQFIKNPQSFVVGGITFLASIQFLGLGFLSLQNKRYFEELFHISSSIKKDLEPLKEQER
jgi:hypothetical protein